MKEQYVGDVNDYRKYALLRHLSRGGSTRIGVCWMLTPPDGSTDGNINGYLRDAARWRHFDPELFDLLSRIGDETDPRRLRLIERSGIIPRAVYFNEFLSDRAELRRAYLDIATRDLGRTDLIFFDPDNGLAPKSIAIGQTGSSKYIYLDEIAAAFGQGHSVLIYQHFVREEREAFIARLVGDLQTQAPTAVVWAFRTPNVVFFLLIHPTHGITLGAAAEEARDRWPTSFIRGQRFGANAQNIGFEPAVRFNATVRLRSIFNRI